MAGLSHWLDALSLARLSVYLIKFIVSNYDNEHHCRTQDVFYLTMEELFAFVDGRAVTNNLSELAQIRKREFDGYRKVRSREGPGIYSLQ